jgi:hypothetical protein
MDEEYTKIESKYYNYKAKEDLLLYFNEDIRSFDHVYICSYKVNVESLQPFLSFLLTKSSNTLQWPEVPIFKNFEASELIIYSKIFLFGLYKLYDLENFTKSLIFNGFYTFEKNLYLFFDNTNCDTNINDIYSNNPNWFSIIDEIVNHKNVCNFKIEKNVTDLLLSNENLCFLTDKNDNNYEIPIVSFVGTSKEKVKFKYKFGESSQNKNAILGPYFYFTNFNNSFKSQDIGLQEINTNNDCIIRFAIFTGKVKYIENNINDPIDESEVKMQRLKDSKLNEYNEFLTNRISDHDGLWSISYNSAYLGLIELDNGKKIENTQIIVIKEYEQQTPLSYHYINKKMIEEDTSYFAIL